MLRKLTSAALIILAIASIASMAQSQTPPENPLGWNRARSLALNYTINSSSNVVGQTDGTAQTYGLNFRGSLTHRTERGEWRNSLSALESTSRTSAIPRYIKASDEAKVESIYLRSIEKHPSLGPFAKVEAAAPIFKGEDVRATNSSYAIDYRSRGDETINASSLRLTGGFKPLTTKESVGAFWKPIREENQKLELRIGFGALQVAAAGQLAVTGVDSASGRVNVKELDDVSQGGLELALSWKHTLDEKTTYEVGAESLTPFLNDKDPGDDRSAVRLTNIEGFVKLVSKINSWASLGYDYKLKIQPQVVDRAQQTHTLVLSCNL